MDIDRRFAKRIKMNCQGILFLPEEEVPVRIKDISRGGILFDTEEYGFCIGDSFDFQFVDEEYNVVSGKAKLVRVSQGPGMISIGCRCPSFDPRGYIEKLEIKNAVECMLEKAV